MDLAALLTWENAVALLTLSAMEIVLGIDNIVFITILVGKLPEHQRSKVRITGLVLALVMRIALLFGLKWIMGLTAPLFTVLDREVSGKSILLLAGGLFLVAKATYEIHQRADNRAEHVPTPGKAAASVAVMYVQIIALDLVFSLDSVITAVGMAQHIEIMVAAVLIAVGTMIAVSGPIGAFVDRHPAIKMLALAFLVLIGVMLIADGVGEHIPRGYIYFAMAFSLVVEILNIRAGARRHAAPPS